MKKSKRINRLLNSGLIANIIKIQAQEYKIFCAKSNGIPNLKHIAIKSGKRGPFAKVVLVNCPNQCPLIIESAKRMNSRSSCPALATIVKSWAESIHKRKSISVKTAKGK